MNKYVERARRDESGFTLIELLIVIVILGILAGIVIFAVGGITDRGNVSACKTDLKTIEVGVEAYYAKMGFYPANLTPTLTENLPKSATDDEHLLFLRPQTGLTTSALAGSGFTITYAPSASTPGGPFDNYTLSTGTPPFC